MAGSDQAVVAFARCSDWLRTVSGVYLGFAPAIHQAVNGQLARPVSLASRLSCILCLVRLPGVYIACAPEPRALPDLMYPMEDTMTKILTYYPCPTILASEKVQVRRPGCGPNVSWYQRLGILKSPAVSYLSGAE